MINEKVLNCENVLAELEDNEHTTAKDYYAKYLECFEVYSVGPKDFTDLEDFEVFIATCCFYYLGCSYRFHDNEYKSAKKEMLKGYLLEDFRDALVELKENEL